MSPMLIGSLHLLKENRDLWPMKDISEALRRVRENEKQKRAKNRLQARSEEAPIATDARLQ